LISSDATSAKCVDKGQTSRGKGPGEGGGAPKSANYHLSTTGGEERSELRQVLKGSCLWEEGQKEKDDGEKLNSRLVIKCDPKKGQAQLAIVIRFAW